MGLPRRPGHRASNSIGFGDAGRVSEAGRLRVLPEHFGRHQQRAGSVDSGRMTTWEAVFTGITIVLLALVIIGLATSGRWRRINALPVYTILLLSTQLAVFLWPARFYVWHAWLGQELLARLLSAAVVIEILMRIFAVMPAARQVAVRALAGVALLTVVALLSVRIPYREAPFGADPLMLALVVDVLPRLAYLTMVVCLLALALTWFYRVPLDPLHRAIMYGFTPYLTVYALTRGSTQGAVDHAVANMANTAAYILMLLLWAHAAWRREREPPAARGLMELVQPWRR